MKHDLESFDVWNYNIELDFKLTVELHHVLIYSTYFCENVWTSFDLLQWMSPLFSGDVFNVLLSLRESILTVRATEITPHRLQIQTTS